MAGQGKIGRVMGGIVRLALCFALTFFMAGLPLAALITQALPAHADITEVGKVVKIKASAYPVKNDAEHNWDTTQRKTTTISENGGQLRICITAVLDDGSGVPQYESESWGQLSGMGDGFTYTWGGKKLSVDSTGLVTALGNGTTTVTVVPKNEELGQLSAQIDIETANQGEGLIVTKVRIVDAKGKAYGDDAIKLTSEKITDKAYCSITYTDKQSGELKTLSNHPDAGERLSADDAAKITWSLSDDQYASISTAADGAVSIKGLAVGVIRLRCAVTGGDTTKDDGMGKGVVVDKVTVNIANGKNVHGGSPASKLTVKVYYEKDPDKVAKTVTYTKKRFEALGAITRTYTLTKSAGKYVTDRAYGVPIATLLTKLGIDVDDIRYFTLSANDGANPGKISAKWLLKQTRYHFPNYDIGGSKQEAEQVPTMLALKDSWSNNSMETDEMNAGTCFRLMFGSATSNDSATDKSIKFINTLNIVLAGAAPSSHGKDEKKPSTGGGSGSGSGGTSGDGHGNGSGDGRSGSGSNQGTQGGGSVGSATSGAGKGIRDNAQHQKLQKVDSETSWSIHQMMNKSKSDVSVLYEDPNLIPLAIGITCILFFGTAAVRTLIFRRRLRC